VVLLATVEVVVRMEIFVAGPPAGEIKNGKKRYGAAELM
jgi:hypothetical protein